MPSSALAFGTSYTLTLGTGVRLADGTPFDSEVNLPFTTEAGPSLRLLASFPVWTLPNVDPDAAIWAFTFDAALDPSTVGLETVQLLQTDTRQPVDAERRLSMDRRTLTLVPAVPLNELTQYEVILTSGVKNTAGDPLSIGTGDAFRITTALRDLDRITAIPSEIVFTRADLADRQIQVTGIFDDGSSRNLTTGNSVFYIASNSEVADFELDGFGRPTGNGETVVTVNVPSNGHEAYVRVKVEGVLPEIDLRGRRTQRDPTEDIIVAFSEAVDVAPLAYSNPSLTDIVGNAVAANFNLSLDGQTLTVDPTTDLDPGATYFLRFDLAVTDDNGLTRNFPQKIVLSTFGSSGPIDLPPVISLTSPTNGSSLIADDLVTLTATATDDDEVSSVQLFIDGLLTAELFAAPYTFEVGVPTNTGPLAITLVAIDSAGQAGTFDANYTVIPDPLTTVVGTVLLPGGSAAVGAEVSARGITALSDGSGQFSLVGVSTIRGTITLSAFLVDSGLTLSGSANLVPVRGGTTNAGTVQLVEARFETDLGIDLNQTDDDFDFVDFAEGFTFPFFGVEYTGVFVGSNGYLTFDNGDRTYNPSIPNGVVNGQPRISVLFTDLDPRFSGGVFWNLLE